MISRQHLLQASSMMVLVAGFAGNALAQGGGLEEITVTARRVEENLMQVPLAISAVTANDIGNMGMRDLIDLGKTTPGLFASVSGNGRTDRSSTKLTFRGLSVASGNTFIDGAPLAAANAGTPDITDVARVEVLKGPQAVYFGRSTYSGAVNYVLKEPGDRFGGSFAADLWSYGSSDIRVSLEGPVSEKLGLRVSGRRYYTGGQYKNPLASTRLGQQETDSFSLYALAKPTDSLKISANYSWQKDEDGTPTEAVMLARSYTGGTTSQRTGGELQCNLGGTGGPYWCGQLPDITAFTKNNPLFISVPDRINPVTRYRLIDNLPVTNNAGRTESYPFPFPLNWLDHFGLKRIIQNAHGRADFTTESDWSLSAIASWNRVKSASMTDQNYRDTTFLINPLYAQFANIPGSVPQGDEHPLANNTITTDFSGEFRVASPAQDRLRGVAGVSYLRVRNPNDGGLTGYGINGTVQNATNFSLIKTPAVFGAAYFDFTPEVTLTAEARYQWDKVERQQTYPTVGPALSNTFKSFSPRISLDWKYTDNSLLYALWSRGYRPGGFNTILVSGTPIVIAQLASAGASLAFQQEKLDNFEIGHKGTWFNNSLQTTLAVYYDKWNQGQVINNFFVCNSALVNGVCPAALSQFPVTTNVGAVNLSGVEFDARWAPTEHISVTGSLGFTHNEIKNYIYVPDGPKIKTGGQNVNGNRLSQSPKWTFSLSPQYTNHLTGDWDWFARVDWTFRDKYFIDNTNVAWTAPLSLVNLRAGIQTDKFKLEGYVNNVFSNMAIPEAVAGSCCSDIIGNNFAGSAIRVGVPSKLVLGAKASYKF